MITVLLTSLKGIDSKLFLTLLLMGLFPTVYTTVRIFFLGGLPSDWGFNIASQISWVNLAYEVLQEGLILPLFFLIGQVIAQKDQVENRIRTGLFVVGIAYGTIALFLWIFVEPLSIFMSQKAELIPATIEYIRLETIASFFSILSQFLILVLISIKKESILLITLGVQMVLTIICDVFLVSTLAISAQLGVNGIAISNIIVNIVVLCLVVILLTKQGYRVLGGGTWSFEWLKDWLKVGGFSGLESFVRNLAFILMVIRMVNMVGEQGTFWTANSFIWNWLLLPVIQLGQLIKSETGRGGMEVVQRNIRGYFVLTGIIVVLWFVSLPGWSFFLQHVMKLDNYSQVLQIVLISVGFYVLFAFNNVCDSVFYGLGKTNYMLFQSLIINILFYGTLFILYLMGIYQPTLWLIALMFAVGIAFDSLLTFGMFVQMMRRNKSSTTARS